MIKYVITSVGLMFLHNTTWAYKIIETPYSITYEFDDVYLASGEQIQLTVPEQFVGKKVLSVSITHKQDPRSEDEPCKMSREDKKAAKYAARIDCFPGFTSVEVKDKSISEKNMKWRYWGGHGSGPLNSKFAEVRAHSGETDKLYEWSTHGHFSVDGFYSNAKDYRKSLVALEGARIRSVGPDGVIIQRLQILFEDEKINKFADIIYSKGMVFGDLSGRGRRYPNNPNRGDYGNSYKLYPSHNSCMKISTADKRKCIILDKISFNHLRFIEVAVGDLKLMPVTASNIEPYRRNAKLNVTILNESPSFELKIVEKENIGTNGVIRGYINSAVLNQSRIVVWLSDDEADVMGIRLGYE